MRAVNESCECELGMRAGNEGCECELGMRAGNEGCEEQHASELETHMNCDSILTVYSSSISTIPQKLRNESRWWLGPS